MELPNVSQFFVVYFELWLAQRCKDFPGMEMPKLTQLMENAKLITEFCPMLVILFVGTRMRDDPLRRDPCGA